MQHQPQSQTQPQPQPFTIRWWLVRHAPVINPQDMAYGSMDLDAGFDDMDQRIAYLRQALPRPGNIRTSALVRSQQTLHAVWPDAKHSIDAGWNEQSLGAWEGQPRTKIYARNGPIRQLFQDPENFRPPTSSDGLRIGENWNDLTGRVSTSLMAAQEDPSTRDELVFCHAGTIRAALGFALALTPEQAFGFVVDNMSLTRMDSVHFQDQGVWQQRWRFGGVNLGPAPL